MTYMWYGWETIFINGHWEFNDRRCSGTTYELTGKETDDELVVLLGGNPEEIGVDDDCDPQYSIIFVQRKDGKPLGELVPAEG